MQIFDQIWAGILIGQIGNAALFAITIFVSMNALHHAT
jgi:hypothetical protein